MSNSLKEVAKEIETIAVELQAKIDKGEDIFSLAADLSQKNLTFVFVLGENSAKKPKLQRKAKIVAGSKSFNRDKFGRFAKV